MERPKTYNPHLEAIQTATEVAALRMRGAIKGMSIFDLLSRVYSGVETLSLDMQDCDELWVTDQPSRVYEDICEGPVWHVTSTPAARALEQGQPLLPRRMHSADITTHRGNALHNIPHILTTLGIRGTETGGMFVWTGKQFDPDDVIYTRKIGNALPREGDENITDRLAWLVCNLQSGVGGETEIQEALRLMQECTGLRGTWHDQVGRALRDDLNDPNHHREHANDPPHITRADDYIYVAHTPHPPQNLQPVVIQIDPKRVLERQMRNVDVCFVAPGRDPTTLLGVHAIHPPDVEAIYFDDPESVEEGLREGLERIGIQTGEISEIDNCYRLGEGGERVTQAPFCDLRHPPTETRTYMKHLLDQRIAPLMDISFRHSSLLHNGFPTIPGRYARKANVQDLAKRFQMDFGVTLKGGDFDRFRLKGLYPP